MRRNDGDHLYERAEQTEDGEVVLALAAVRPVQLFVDSLKPMRGVLGGLRGRVRRSVSTVRALHALMVPLLVTPMALASGDICAASDGAPPRSVIPPLVPALARAGAIG